MMHSNGAGIKKKVLGFTPCKSHPTLNLLNWEVNVRREVEEVNGG